MDIKRGVIFSANAIGARIWQGLIDGLEQSAIAASISRDYGVDLTIAQADVNEFVRSLVDRGIAEYAQS